MLDHLPDELLLAVMAALDSPSSGANRYSHRQRDLGALCLASRRLCRIAQPVLQQQLNLDPIRINTIFGGPAERIKAASRNARAVNFDSPGYFDFNPAVGLLRLLFGLQELRISACGYGAALNLELLRPHLRLRRFALGDILVDERHCVAFPLVEVLHLRDAHLSRKFRDKWLTSTSFPSLKALKSDGRVSRVGQPFAALSTLEVVQLETKDQDLFTRCGNSDKPAFLFEIDTGAFEYDEINILPRHVLLRSQDSSNSSKLLLWEDDLVEGLPRLTDLVKRQRPSIVDGRGGTLILPRCLLDIPRRPDDAEAEVDDSDSDSYSDVDSDVGAFSSCGSDSGSSSASVVSSSPVPDHSSYEPKPRLLRRYARLVAACAKVGRTILYDECYEPIHEYINETFWAHLRRTRRAREGTTSGREL